MSERLLTKEEQKRYPNVRAFAEDGSPIFKKKIKEISILHKRDKVEKVVYAIVFLIMCIHSISLIFPTLWMFMSSLKDVAEYYKDISPLGLGNPLSLPDKWLWSNYVDAFTSLDDGNGTSFFGLIWNSLWYTVLKSSLNVLIPAFCGYVMCKYRFWGREVLFTYIIITMTLPIYGSGAAYIELVSALGYIDTPLYVVIANLGGFSASFIVYHGFFKSVSNSYSEAAKIDGANAFTIFFRIILPQAMPVLLTYWVVGAIANWNAYEEMILYIPSYPTLASGMYTYSKGRNNASPIYLAGIIISAIPTMVLFCACSRKIMTSLSIGGLKG